MPNRQEKNAGRRARRLLTGAVVALGVGALGFGDADTVPWPAGRAYTDPELTELIQAELDVADNVRFEEFFDAAERGEAAEGTFILQEDIDAGAPYTKGLPDENLPARLFRIGDDAFAHRFDRINGFGHTERTRMKRVHNGGYGGVDGFSCAGCHQQGGANGSGVATASTFYFGDGSNPGTSVVRNPPNVLGLGIVQEIGVEMTQELHLARDIAKQEAADKGKPVTVKLSAHGVDFGTLTAKPDGTFDTSQVVGVDAGPNASDLTIKPFGWKGHTARLRRFAERAARIHFGVQSHVLALASQQKPDPDLGVGPWWDPDGDGVQRELEEGSLTALALYLAQLEIPVMLPPYDPGLREDWAYGAALFEQIKCSGCHRPTMLLTNTVWYEKPDTTDGPPVEVRLLEDGVAPRGTNIVALYSDLKRHHMGDRLKDPNDDPDGVGRDQFITRPLWGIAESPPYLHDGRANSIHEAILEHGGEAQGPRDTFVGLSEQDQRRIEVFLLSLSRTPVLRVPQ
jgi:hypothetical protein